MLQKSGYLSLYCKMLANPRVKSEVLTLFLQYFYPLGTFFVFAILLIVDIAYYFTFQ